MTRRLSALKIVGAVVAVMVVLILAAVFVIRAQADSRWARFEDRLKQMGEAERRRDFRRPPLWGAVTPGNAWDDYKRAVPTVRVFVKPERLEALLNPATEPSLPELQAIAAKYQAELGFLRDGAHHDRAEFGYDWNRGMSMVVPDLVSTQRLAQISLVRARALQLEGRFKDALDAILDTAQLGLDHLGGPVIGELSGWHILGQSLDQAASLVRVADRGTLSVMEESLTLLSQRLPREPAMPRTYPLLLGMTLRDGGLSGMDLGSRLSAWRVGYSTRLMSLNAFDQVCADMDRATTTQSLPWREQMVVLGGIQQEMVLHWNPLVRLTAPGPVHFYQAPRELGARINLIRAAAQYRLTGELPSLEDPYGDKLRSAPSGKGVKLWSVGADGTDGGGVGEWRWVGSQDIVLEVEK